ncbi:MAG: SIMPL domain-containing protein, partial [Candidatus Moraniibacteriota bacterium]
IEKAKVKAARIAEDAGFEIGQLVSIYETPTGSGFGGEGDMLSAKSAAVNVPAPSLEPGTDETTVNVTLTYEIR